jgi:2-polyprenyl-3-methyl-5-hydroxy-6-metoxy-1,4-benzoquinol methylase
VISVAPPTSTSTTCPLCGSTGGAPAFRARDRNRGVSEEEFDYLRCPACQTLFIQEIPANLDRFYPDDYFDAPPAGRLAELAAAEQPKLDLVLEHVAPPGRLVEIGPGDGLFAWLCRRAGFDVTVIERSPAACEHLRRSVGLDVRCTERPESALGELPPSRVIALWQVIEHLPEPGALLDAAAANLEPGGLLVIAAPNPEALGFRWQGPRWAHVDAPRHLTLIPVDAIVNRAADRGLRRRALAFDDPSGRHWNRFAWEYAMRRDPASGPAGRLLGSAAALLSKAVSPIEGRGRRGASYTLILEKQG